MQYCRYSCKLLNFTFDYIHILSIIVFLVTLDCLDCIVIFIDVILI